MEMLGRLFYKDDFGLQAGGRFNGAICAANGIAIEDDSAIAFTILSSTI